MAMFGSGHMTK